MNDSVACVRRGLVLCCAIYNYNGMHIHVYVYDEQDLELYPRPSIEYANESYKSSDSVESLIAKVFRVF